MPRAAATTVRTERDLAALRARAVAYDVPVSGTSGLQVRVHPDRRRSFVLRYQGQGGVRRRHVIGDYGEGLKLAEAVEAATRARVAILDGRDPAAERAAAVKAARTGDNLAEVWRAYAEAAPKGLHGGRGRPKSATTLAAEASRWRTWIAPRLGRRTVVGFTAADAASFMREVAEAGGAPDSVNSVGRVLRVLLAYAVHVGLIQSNPAEKVCEPMEERARGRLWGEEAAGQVWRALEGELGPVHGVGLATTLAIRFATLTLARRRSAVGLRWEEIGWGEMTWTCPASRHKSRKAFLTPLTGAALIVLREAAEAVHGADVDCTTLSGPVFTSARSKGEPLAPSSLTRALERVRVHLGLERASLHDFRATAATRLRRAPYSLAPWVPSLFLSHAVEGQARVTAAHYDLYDNAPEKLDALEKWADALDKMSQASRQRQAA